MEETGVLFKRGCLTPIPANRSNQLLGASAGLSMDGSAVGFFIIEW
jgi:hypothetical protein